MRECKFYGKAPSVVELSIQFVSYRFQQLPEKKMNGEDSCEYYDSIKLRL